MGKLENVERAKDCTHPFVNLDGRNVGTCRFCGAQFQYYPEDKKPRELIKPGISLTSGDPKELDVSIKRSIAWAAKEHGIAWAMEKFGIEMRVIRAWLAAYTRSHTKLPTKQASTEGTQIISIVILDSGKCPICEDRILDTDYNPYLITYGNKKSCLCGRCGQLAMTLFELLGIQHSICTREMTYGEDG